MTTIVYRDGIMAGDSRAYSGNFVVIGNKVKVFKIDDRLIGVSASQVGLPEEVLDWFRGGMIGNLEDIIKIDENCMFQILSVDQHGAASYYNKSMHPANVMAEYYAIGSGDTYALGALAQGATAKEAVLAASQFDSYTNDDIHTIKFIGRAV